MASPVEIANMALNNVGVRETIASLTEASQEARTCNIHFEQAVLDSLSGHPWPFAKRRKALALIESNPNSEWLYRYALPIDCVEPRYIEGAARNLPVELRPKWELEAAEDALSTTVMTGEVNPVLVYTTSALPTGLYPPYFVSLISWHLAERIVIPLTTKFDAAQVVMKMLAIIRNNAQARASNQRQADDELPSEFERARN